MQNRLKFMISAAALFAVAAFLIGCGAPAANNTATNTSTTNHSANNSTTAPANNSKADNSAADNTADNKDAKDDAASKDESASADKIGVAECDDFIAKYNACVTKNVPEASRAAIKAGFDSAVKGWKAAAATAQGKATLASSCKTMSESLKAGLSTYKCEW